MSPQNSTPPGIGLGRVLVVEDEVLIGERIVRYLEEKGYQVTALALDYEEAVGALAERLPDVCLIDINLATSRSGIDLGQYVRQRFPDLPFAYLTSQVDPHTLDRAKATFPAGYLTKPVQPSSLHSTLSVALHASRHGNGESIGSDADDEQAIVLRDQRGNYVVKVRRILFARAEHVYVDYQLDNGDLITQREPLKEARERLAAYPEFVSVHRSFIVNLSRVARWDSESLYLGEHRVPVSRSRRRAVEQQLRELRGG